jgi:hypothetical protein
MPVYCRETFDAKQQGKGVADGPIRMSYQNPAAADVSQQPLGAPNAILTSCCIDMPSGHVPALAGTLAEE